MIAFCAPRSNEAMGDNAVATFAYSMMFNMNGLRGNEHDTCSKRDWLGALDGFRNWLIQQA